MIKLAIKSRFPLYNGDYICYIENENLTMVFRKDKVADSTHKAMEASKVKHYFDGKSKIIQEMTGKDEETILLQVIDELKEIKKNKYKLQILEWNYEKI